MAQVEVKNILKDFIPKSVMNLTDLQTDIPRIAKDKNIISDIDNSVSRIPTNHTLYQADSQKADFLKPQSVHLIVTSPPYWTLKEYPDTNGQIGRIEDYTTFLESLDSVWQLCYKALVPGGRLICVVGDVCLSRKKNNGDHTVVPLHASIQERCMKIGFMNLAPIIWYKITNANYESDNGSTFLGKPYEPNAIIKNDIEYILMERKPGGYRRVTSEQRLLSVVSEDNHTIWFQQIWTDIAGASTKLHPAPFPLNLAERLVRMFSFVGDTVLDPFMGTGTTNVAAAKWGRNSIGIEINQDYLNLAFSRLYREANQLFSSVTIEKKILE